MKKLKIVFLLVIMVCFIQNYCALGAYFTTHAWVFGSTAVDVEEDIWYAYPGHSTADEVSLTATVYTWWISHEQVFASDGAYGSGTATISEAGNVMKTLEVYQDHSGNGVPGIDGDSWAKPRYHPGADKVEYYLEGKGGIREIEGEWDFIGAGARIYIYY